VTENQTNDEALEILNLKLVKDFGGSIDMNADIINATREMAHKILVIRSGHLAEAERLWDIVEDLAVSAKMTADMLADTISAEWGIEKFTEFESDEETDEDEEDE
jgi:predicted transposase YbfD/YdcC